MPELPEVETVRKGLASLVLNRKISTVDVYWDRIISGPIHSEEFSGLLTGETINTIERRGKYLIFLLDHWAMVSHLRMEGKYEMVAFEESLKKHTHVVFHFTDGHDLRYLDVRKFGRMTLVPLGEQYEVTGLKDLGPEPFQETFEQKKFADLLSQKNKAIKPLLLDQSIVAGLGNIYVDEALFMARIHPLRPASSLGVSEARKLHESIISVIALAVEAGGTTVRSYQNALSQAGTFQVKLNVYGKRHLPCVHCGTPIEKLKVAQRGTHICPKCQILTPKNCKPILKKEVTR